VSRGILRSRPVGKPFFPPSPLPSFGSPSDLRLVGAACRTSDRLLSLFSLGQGDEKSGPLVFRVTPFHTSSYSLKLIRYRPNAIFPPGSVNLYNNALRKRPFYSGSFSFNSPGQVGALFFLFEQLYSLVAGRYHTPISNEHKANCRGRRRVFLRRLLANFLRPGTMFCTPLLGISPPFRSAQGIQSAGLPSEVPGIWKRRIGVRNRCYLQASYPTDGFLCPFSTPSYLPA